MWNVCYHLSLSKYPVTCVTLLIGYSLCDKLYTVQYNEYFALSLWPIVLCDTRLSGLCVSTC